MTVAGGQRTVWKLGGAERAAGGRRAVPPGRLYGIRGALIDPSLACCWGRGKTVCGQIGRFCGRSVPPEDAGQVGRLTRYTGLVLFDDEVDVASVVKAIARRDDAG